jgi:hypothetical protein
LHRYVATLDVELIQEYLRSEAHLRQMNLRASEVDGIDTTSFRSHVSRPRPECYWASAALSHYNIGIPM